nr:DnaD and phage-associated domain-containing protein [uncultured Mediterranean phage uvMED]
MDKRLTPIDFKVYCGLVSYMKAKDGKCFPRYATIAKRIGISKRSVQRSCQNLANLKLITKKRLQSTNQYLLNQQHTLEISIKKRVNRLTGFSEKTNRNVLVKPFKYNQYYSKGRNVNNSNNRSMFSPHSTERHSIEYNGKKYKETGKEGFWVEYAADDGSQIRKHSFKNTIEEVKSSRKKFEAAAEKAVACVS